MGIGGGGGNYSPLLSLTQHVVATSIANDACGPAGGHKIVLCTPPTVLLNLHVVRSDDLHQQVVLCEALKLREATPEGTQQRALKKTCSFLSIVSSVR